MTRILVPALCGAFLLAAVSAEDVLAQKKKVEITKKYSGSVADEKAHKPAAITTAKKFEALWKEWKADGDVPKVDFGKNIVVAVYSVGSNLNMAGATLDENTGNLTVLGFGTRDIRPGFRYVLGVVSKDGIKTVDGKALPKD